MAKKAKKKGRKKSKAKAKPLGTKSRKGQVNRTALQAHLRRAAMRKRLDEVLLNEGHFAVVDESRSVVGVSSLSTPPLGDWGTVGIGELGLFLSILGKVKTEDDMVQISIDKQELRMKSGKIVYVYRLTEAEFIRTQLEEGKAAFKRLQAGAVALQIDDIDPLVSAISVMSPDQVVFEASGGMMRAIAQLGTQHRAEVELGEVDGNVSCLVPGDSLADVLSVLESPVRLLVSPDCVLFLDAHYGHAVSALEEATGEIEEVEAGAEAGKDD